VPSTDKRRCPVGCDWISGELRQPLAIDLRRSQIELSVAVDGQSTVGRHGGEEWEHRSDGTLRTRHGGQCKTPSVFFTAERSAKHGYNSNYVRPSVRPSHSFTVVVRLLCLRPRSEGCIINGPRCLSVCLSRAST